MRAHFPMPPEPMGEAWFMGEKRYFFEWLKETPVVEADAFELGRCLFEIASGTSSFGRRREWEEWFRHLIPELVGCGHETHPYEALLEATITAFMVLFPSGLEDEYEGFREDALATLGARLMAPVEWEGCDDAARPLGRFLRWEDEEGAVGPAGWDAGRACEPLSASLFFCLKYLKEDEVEAWAESVFAIEDPYFRASLAVWLLGALDLLEAEEARPSAIERPSPSVGWHNSFLLESSYEGHEPFYNPVNDVRDFLPRANREAFVRAVRRLVTPETLIAWADLFSEDRLLQENFYHVPDMLFDRLSKETAG